MSKPETVTVELTADEILAVTNSCGPYQNYTTAMEKLNTALAQHRRQRKRNALGLPWEVRKYNQQWGLFLNGSLCPTWLAVERHPLDVVVAGTKALELLESVVEYMEDTGHEGEPGTILAEARAILKEAGLD